MNTTTTIATDLEQLNEILIQAHRVEFYLDLLAGINHVGARDSLLVAHLPSMRAGCRAITEGLHVISEGGAP